MFGVENNVILITGAGQGLGKAIAKNLAQHGAIVIASDIKQNAVDTVVNEIHTIHGKAKAITMDVSNEESVENGVQEILKEFGKIDAVINNAGIDVTKPLEELSIEEWDRIIRVNLRGPFIVSKKIFPLMRAQKHGHIINISSTAAKRAWPNASAYHASKWGLLGFSHALHTEGRMHNVKVTAVVAGGMQTPFILDRFPDVDSNTLQDPKNVAETIRFILSLPPDTVIAEVMVLPRLESSWP